MHRKTFCQILFTHVLYNDVTRFKFSQILTLLNLIEYFYQSSYMKYVISEAWVWVECWGLECYLIKCVWQDCHIPLSHAFSALQYIFLVLILVKSTKVNGMWYFKFTRAPLKSMSSSYFQRHCAKKCLKVSGWYWSLWWSKVSYLLN